MLNRLILVLALVGVLFGLVGAQAAPQRIKPGDKVTVTCEEEPTLNREYTITRDGLILVAFIGAVPVAGLTEAEASDRIAKKLVDERILARATVRVRLVEGPTQPVRVRGAISSPSEVPWRPEFKLSELLRQVRPTESANLRRIEIQPAVGERIFVDTVGDGEMRLAQDPLLRPGDDVFVPILERSPDIIVVGAVNKPGPIAYKAGMTVRQALEAAGGTTVMADLALVRIDLEGGVSDTIDLRDPREDRALKAGDRVTVTPQESVRSAMVQGQVRRPGRVIWRDGLTLTQALTEAGGATRAARLDRVVIIRNVDGRRTEIVANADRMYKGLDGAVVLLADDQVIVSEQRRRSANRPLQLALGAAALFFLFGR